MIGLLPGLTQSDYLGTVSRYPPSDRPIGRRPVRVGSDRRLNFLTQSDMIQSRPEPGRVRIDSVVIFNTRAERATLRTSGRAPSRIDS
jgi:hypothetical protein